MEQEMMMALAKVGGYAAVGLAAMGSSMGTGIAGAAAIGAWKKCYQQDKPAPFLLLAMAGAPLSQTIYGMIMMILISGAAAKTPGMFTSMSRIIVVSLSLLFTVSMVAMSMASCWSPPLCRGGQRL